MLSRLPNDILESHVLSKLDAISQVTFCCSFKNNLKPNLSKLKQTALLKMLGELSRFKHFELIISFGYKFTLDISWILNRLHVISKKIAKKAKHSSFSRYSQGIKATVAAIDPLCFEEPIKISFRKSISLYDQGCFNRRYSSVFEVNVI
jgi:hypothetical protein